MLNPMHRLGTAISIGQQQYVVAGCLDSKGQRQFLGTDDTCLYRYERQTQIGITAEVFVQHLLRSILATIVDHDDLIMGVVLLQERLQIRTQIDCLVAGTDDDADTLLIGITL